jgi:hypothetical protein
MNELLLRKTLRSDEIYKQIDVDLDSVEYFVDFTKDGKDVLVVGSDVDMDSLKAESKGSLWRTQLNPLGKKLSKLLDDEVHSLKAGLFATNANTRIIGKGTGGKTKLFTPFMLVFDDGQVLTAQARNEKNYKKINASKPMFISHWFLNEKDITDLVANDDPTVQQLAERLKKIIEKVHFSFIKNNKVGKDLEKKKSELKDKIDAIVDKFEKSLRDDRVKELLSQYNNRENILESGYTNNGVNQAKDIRAKNRKIEAELKKLGVDAPEQIVPDLPKTKPDKPRYNIYLPENKIKYVDAIKMKFEEEESFQAIIYRFFYKNHLGNTVMLDAIEENEIEIVGEDESVKNEMIGIIVEVSKGVDLRTENKIYFPDEIKKEDTKIIKSLDKIISILQKEDLTNKDLDAIKSDVELVDSNLDKVEETKVNEAETLFKKKIAEYKK